MTALTGGLPMTKEELKETSQVQEILNDYKAELKKKIKKLRDKLRNNGYSFGATYDVALDDVLELLEE